MTSPSNKHSYEKRLTINECANNERSKQPLFENSLWDIKQTSEKLNVSEKTIRDWVYKRQIPFKKIGKLVRFHPSEIHQWIEERSTSYGYREDF